MIIDKAHITFNKEHKMKKITSCLFMALFVSNGYSGTMGAVVAEPNAYFSVFGGGGTLNNLSIKLLGTSFQSLASGGTLAVNGFGHTGSTSQWLVGANMGYIFQNILFPFYDQGTVKPVAEVEGYYIGKRTLNAFQTNIGSTRVEEHDFYTGAPMQSGVGLVNALLSFSHNTYSQWHPYVGGGVGAAVVSINKAHSIDLAPGEGAISYFNGSPSHANTAFAAQAKAGLNYQWTPNWSIFGEYRYLYLSPTTFTLGSTVATGHVPTSPWTVELASQSYNLGSAGIRYSF